MQIPMEEPQPDYWPDLTEAYRHLTGYIEAIVHEVDAGEPDTPNAYLTAMVDGEDVVRVISKEWLADFCRKQG